MNILQRLLSLFKRTPSQQPVPLPDQSNASNATNSPGHSSEPVKNTTASFNPDLLTDVEWEYCRKANVEEKDALWLKRFTRRPIESLELQSLIEDEPKPPVYAICSLTTEEKARHVVIEQLAAFIQKGQYIFISDMAHNGCKVAIVSSTSDPYEIMRYTGTNGCNYDVYTEDIIDKYKKWDKEYGIRVILIEDDCCECTLINPPVDFKALADEVYEFCPDVVEQGTDTVENLAVEIQRGNSIFLWWD